MALGKTLTLGTGAEATYHRIVKVIGDVEGGRVIARLAQYLDADVRAAGKAPMAMRDVEFKLADFDADPGRADLYAAIKADISDFANAEDV